ncbi:phosphohydrolase [Desulfuromonas soudanensis]|uniref:Phosphohydrolase n=1 Tax=Desulfuromonas soudanensis TaxID=1603606 RepID=A0A0M5IU41_9BACT|nr:HD domain-containing protein [Desulfuromonas soudanensis]ALC16944.1 phosphohydrolase [Desulfuromonas soudanensis]
MNPLALIDRYYPPGTLAHAVLLRHSTRVAARATAVAARLRCPVDLPFVEEAALLHDIGILYTDAPELGCSGTLPYLAHAYKGRELLESEGLARHALVCDRHIGVGLSAAEIAARHLPLPARDMFPVTLEEQIVTYADLFFSKNPQENDRERSFAEVRSSVERYGAEKLQILDAWYERFGP